MVFMPMFMYLQFLFAVFARLKQSIPENAVNLFWMCVFLKFYNVHMGVLRNAVRVGVSDFPEKSTMKVYGSTLLELRGGGWVSNVQVKSIM